MDKKKQGMRALVIILVIIGFFYISERFQEKEKTSLSVNEDVFEVADSIEELHKIQLAKMDPYQAHLLKNVYRYDLINEFDDIDIPVMELSRDVKIHESWNDSFSLYLLYSVNLLPGDDKPESIPKLDIKGMTFHNKKGDTLKLALDYLLYGQNNFKLENGVVYNGRIYRTLWIRPQMNEAVFQKFLQWSGAEEMDLRDINDAFASVKQVSFHDAFLIDENEHETPLQNIALEMELSSGMETLANIPVNQTVQLENGNTIDFNSLEIGLRSKRLYLKSSQDLSQLEYLMNGMFQDSPVVKDENGKQFIHINDNILDPENKFEFQFKRAVTYSDKELHATISKAELDAFKTKVEKENEDANLPIDHTIGKVDYTEYILHQLSEADDIPDALGFELEINETEVTSGSFINFQDYTRIKEMMKEHPLHQFPHSLIELTDNKGNPVPIEFDSYRGDTLFFGFDKEKFMELDEINIRLFQLPKKIDIQDNHISIALPKEK